MTLKSGFNFFAKIKGGNYVFIVLVVLALTLPSQQILVPRTSLGRPLPTSPRRPLKILFDHPVDLPNLRPDLMSSGCPELTSRRRPNLASKGRLSEVDSGPP